MTPKRVDFHSCTFREKVRSSKNEKGFRRLSSSEKWEGLKLDQCIHRGGSRYFGWGGGEGALSFSGDKQNIIYNILYSTCHKKNNEMEFYIYSNVGVISEPSYGKM